MAKKKGGLDAYIEIIYGRYCSGIPINIMDICLVMNEGRRLFQEGHKEAADLGPLLRQFTLGVADGDALKAG